MANHVLDRYPALRRVTDTSAVQRCLLVSRAQRLVQDHVRFIVRELRGGTCSYALAASPERRVVLRHRTRDIAIFNELFRARADYDPPRGAAAVLAQIAAERSLRIADLGANIGLFGVDALSRYRRAQVVSYEPDPGNLLLLARCIELNGDQDWTIVEACARASSGTVRLRAGHFADSHVSDVGTEVAAVDILPLLGNFDYIKMDIEGSEWPILRDPRWPRAMQNVSVLAMEWHARGCAAHDPHAAAVSAVRSVAGFTVDPGQHGWHHGTVWAWR